MNYMTVFFEYNGSKVNTKEVVKRNTAGRTDQDKDSSTYVYNTYNAGDLQGHVQQSFMRNNAEHNRTDTVLPYNDSYETLPVVPAVETGADGNSGKGNSVDFKSNVFCNTHTIRDDQLKLNLEIHTLGNLSDRRLQEIKKGFDDSIIRFKDNFGLEPNEKDTTFELYLFDDKEQYEHYGRLYNLGINGAGGMTFYGDADVPYKIYVYQFGEILNLKHELTHALENYASGHSLSKLKINHDIFTEGLADYIQNDGTFIMRELRDKEVTSSVLKEGSSKDIDQVSDAAVAKDQHLSYSIGHAFVTFLQENYPGVISEYFAALREGNAVHAREIISMNKYADFEPWVQSKDISLYLEGMNVLKIDLGEKMFSAKNAVSFENKNVRNEYYCENICTMNGEVVGKISPVVHYADKDTIRTWNIASTDMIEVKPEYSFLKLVSTPSGKSAYVYCDKDGNEYFNTQSYVEYAFNILKKYDENLRINGDFLDIRGRYSDADKVFDKIPNADLLLDQFLDKIGYGNYKQVIMSDPEQVSVIKMHIVKKAFEDFRESEVKKVFTGESGVDSTIKNLLMDLTYINLSDVIGVNGSNIESIVSDPNVMLRTAILGKGDASGISLYVGDQKVAELSTEGGYCVKDLDTNNVNFVFRNAVGNIASSYQDRAYMVVCEKDGEFTTALIDDIQKTEHGNVIWDNQFNHPGINHLYPNYQKVLLNDASLKDYSHLANTRFHHDDTVIVRGDLLDDKGTVTTSDDIHQAVIKHDDQVLHQFKSISFYISEPSTDSAGTYGSDFFIADEGKNLRFQLPKTITHLKLVNVDGNQKLVPCTADGNEHPDGMPSNLTDEYRYIDPIFAHTFEKQSYSKNSVSIGLVDFDKYQEGTMFKLQYYSDDYHINKDEHGNIIRPNNVSYKTKVDLVYDDKVIGMLSDNVNKFQGDVFVAASLNYSHSDFLSSKYFQKVNIEALENGVYSGRYDVGSGDEIANLDTDVGYSDKTVFYFKGSNSPVDVLDNVDTVSTISPYINEFQ